MMIEALPKNIVRFILLVLVQVLILNNIRISGFMIPYVYVLFILLLPFETPGWLLLVVGFMLGMSIDLFMDTPGMHTFSTVFMAFLRPPVLKVIEPRDGYESGTYPRVAYYGFTWFLKYAAILIIVHHFVLFYIEIFRFGDFFLTFFRVILSSLITLLMIILSQFFVFRR